MECPDLGRLRNGMFRFGDCLIFTLVMFLVIPNRVVQSLCLSLLGDSMLITLERYDIQVS